jgi:acyl-coenzyme A thioesterase PaaI-like protein
MKASITELPFNSFLGIQIASEPSQLLRLPSGEQYLNHLGAVHASAQLALAEASSGEFLLRHFGSTDGLVPVVRRLEAKFRKPANGVVTSTATATPESRTVRRRAFAKGSVSYSRQRRASRRVRRSYTFRHGRMVHSTSSGK